MNRFALVFLAASLPVGANAAGKGTQFWNLAERRVIHLELAPAGSTDFGPDQCKNDPDGSVDPDERLKVTGVESGRYDAKIAYKDGRTCVVRGIPIEKGKIFSVEAKALTDCH